MGMQDDWVRITLRLPPTVRDGVADLADREKRSLNNQIVDLLARAVGADVTGYAGGDGLAAPPTLGPLLTNKQARALESFIQATLDQSTMVGYTPQTGAAPSDAQPPRKRRKAGKR